MGVSNFHKAWQMYGGARRRNSKMAPRPTQNQYEAAALPTRKLAALRPRADWVGAPDALAGIYQGLPPLVKADKLILFMLIFLQ